MARSTASLILITLLLSSCTGGSVIHQFRTINGNEGWERTDTLTYEIPEINETRDYAMQIQVRVGTRFPYRSICIAREVKLDNPHILKYDTVRIDISDNDKHIDASGGILYSINGEIKPIRLAKGQKGKIRLTHCMRPESIPHILDIGINLHEL